MEKEIAELVKKYEGPEAVAFIGALLKGFETAGVIAKGHAVCMIDQIKQQQPVIAAKKKA